MGVVAEDMAQFRKEMQSAIADSYSRAHGAMLRKTICKVYCDLSFKQLGRIRAEW